MITTLTGDNSFLLSKELHRRVGSFISEHSDLALERLDGEEASYEQMQGSLESQPFLAARKLVVIRSPSANKEFTERFEALLERIADTTDVILLEPKLDKRLAYYKQLKKQTEFLEYNQLEARELPPWLMTQAKKQGGSLSSADAYYLVERVGANQQLLANELEKLLNYDPQITRQNIDLLSEQTPHSTVFQLLDAAFAGNPKKALKLYEEQRRQRIEPLAIMGMIAWQLHALAVVKTAGDKPSNQIAGEAKLSPFVIQKTQTIADKLSMPELRDLVHQIADLDARLKSTSIDPDEALRQLFIDIAHMI